MPSVEAARPSRCPGCGAASRPPGEVLRLHGHGLRERIRLGPEALGDGSVIGSVTVRRYRCTRCSAVLVVVPRGVLPRLRYGAVAIALALALWSVEGLPAAEVRSRVSPFRVVGHDARRGWRSLRRWARASLWTGPSPPGTMQQSAAWTAQRLAGCASGTGPLTALACAGALLA